MQLQGRQHAEVGRPVGVCRALFGVAQDLREMTQRCRSRTRQVRRPRKGVLGRGGRHRKRGRCRLRRPAGRCFSCSWSVRRGGAGEEEKSTGPGNSGGGGRGRQRLATRSSVTSTTWPATWARSTDDTPASRATWVLPKKDCRKRSWDCRARESRCISRTIAARRSGTARRFEAHRAAPAATQRGARPGRGGRPSRTRQLPPKRPGCLRATTGRQDTTATPRQRREVAEHAGQKRLLWSTTFTAYTAFTVVHRRP